MTSDTVAAPRSRGSGRTGAAIAAALSFHDVRRRFGRTVALDGVSFALAPGEVVGLLGQSGCGKSTLLRIAAGLEEPDAGKVAIDGRTVAEPGFSVPPERRQVGLIFQDFALFPDRTLLSNVAFGLTVLGRGAARAAALSALERLGIAHLADAMPHEASGGEQQRTALARAIVTRPRILLMDEPFSGLDGRLRDSVREETAGVLREIGATAIVVTHDAEEAMRMADRIILMRSGRIVQDGLAEDLFARPASLFVARYFSRLNEVEGIVSGGVAATPIGRFPAPGFPDGASVTVAIRPHGVHVNAGGRPTHLAGRVVGWRFLGETVHVEVAVEGGATHLTARVRDHPRLRLGQDVDVRFEANDCLVFPAESG